MLHTAMVDVETQDLSVEARERAALEAFRATGDGEGWQMINGWNQAHIPLREWDGVGVHENGHVVSLNLHTNGIIGHIPSELGELTNLKTLNLEYNELTGHIPSTLGKLTNLKTLNLEYNKLTGHIPSKLEELAKLEVLNLGHNKLTGHIPSELGKLANLEFLNLNGNTLTEHIPSKLGKLANLETLDLSSNKLTGGIPSELGELAKLKLLSLSNNELTGDIPSKLGVLAKLKKFGVPAKLKSLYLDNNDLTGHIPSELGELAKLEILNLNNNALTGHIPSEFGKLVNLESLNLSRNKLTGRIPSELGRPPQLRKLDLSENELTGHIPSELGKLTNAWQLWLGHNQLTGFDRARDVSIEALGALLDARLESFEGNPFTSPPLALAGNREALKTYYEDLDSSDAPTDLKIAKVLLLGHQGIGKTSLMQTLKNGTPSRTRGEMASTVGVGASAWHSEGDEGSATTFTVIDCGGQAYYHALHRILPAHEASLLLLWDTKTFWDEEGDWDELLRKQAGPWARLMTDMGKSATLSLVGSRIDLLPLLSWKKRSFNWRKASLLDLAKRVREGTKALLVETGSSVVLKDDMHLTSCTDSRISKWFGHEGKGIKELRERLEGMASRRKIGDGLAQALRAVRERGEETHQAGRILESIAEIGGSVRQNKKSTWFRDKTLSEQEAMLRCALQMMEKEGEVIILGDVTQDETLVILNAQFFASIVSPLLTPRQKVLWPNEKDKYVHLDEVTPRRQTSPYNSGNEDLCGVQNLVNPLLGLVGHSFLKSLWEGVLYYPTNPTSVLPDDVVTSMVEKLKTLDILFPASPLALPQLRDVPLGEEKLYQVSWRMPDVREEHGETFGKEIQDKVQGWCSELRQFKSTTKPAHVLLNWGIEVEVKYERPLPSGSVEEFVARLANGGLGQASLCWKQGAWFVREAQYFACLMYNEESKELVLQAFGDWKGGERGAPWAVSFMLHHAPHRKTVKTTLKCPFCANRVDVKQKGVLGCQLACHIGDEQQENWETLQVIRSLPGPLQDGGDAQRKDWEDAWKDAWKAQRDRAQDFSDYLQELQAHTRSVLTIDIPSPPPHQAVSKGKKGGCPAYVPACVRGCLMA